MLKKSSRKRRAAAGRVVRYTRADGTVKVYHYGAHQPKEPTPTPPSDPNTLGALMRAYKRSPRWTNLARSSQITYRPSLDRLLENLETVPVNTITRRHLLDHRDAINEASGPGAALGFATAVGALFSFAVDREYIAVSPATRLRKDIKLGEFEPWTEEDVALAMRHLPERLRRAVVLALHTGQRRSDLTTMRWSQYDGETIKLTQIKTGVKLELPVTAALKAELDAWLAEAKVVDTSGRPVVGTVLTTDKGEPWQPGNLSAQISIYLAKIDGFPEGRSIHGLRKLAAERLAQAGCSERLIMTIGGWETMSMVQHYTKSMNQKIGAKEAIARLEAWQAAKA